MAIEKMAGGEKNVLVEPAALGLFCEGLFSDDVARTVFKKTGNCLPRGAMLLGYIYEGKKLNNIY